MEEIKANEIWKDIIGYEGLYQISNYGRIKSIERKVKYNNSFRNVKEKIRKSFIGNQGYERIELSRDRKNKKYNVHRLVAETFIPNLFNKETVNHKNGIKTDNKVENLEWATRSENELHAYKTGLAKNTEKQRNAVRKYCKENYTKPIIQLDLEGNFIKKWKSAVEVMQILKINNKSINNCIKGRSKTAGGYKWIIAEQFNQIKYEV